MSNNSNTFVSLLAGTAIGAIIGILYAPDSGQNTRKKILKEANIAKDNLSEKAESLKETIVKATSEKKETLEAQMETIVSDASFKAEDVITTLEKQLDALKRKNKNLQKS